MPTLTTDERDCLNHWSMWGSSGYPITRCGRTWCVNGFRGLGACPATFKTKREAAAQWEHYIAVLLDKKAGRVGCP